MKMTIEDLKKFPLHDGEFISLSVTRNEKEELICIIKLKIIDHSYNPGYAIPEKNEITQWHFLNCYKISADIKGQWSGKDTFDDFTFQEDSELIRQLNSFSLKTPKLWHMVIKLHSGSRIEIVAESFELAAS